MSKLQPSIAEMYEECRSLSLGNRFLLVTRPGLAIDRYKTLKWILEPEIIAYAVPKDHPQFPNWVEVARQYLVRDPQLLPYENARRLRLLLLQAVLFLRLPGSSFQLKS